MRLELRWKMKSRKVDKPIYPDQYGSPVCEFTDLYEVLEFRAVAGKDTATIWEEVPKVGLND